MTSFDNEDPQKGRTSQFETGEEMPSDASNKGCMSQECYYQEDTQCPCYMCNNQGIEAKAISAEEGSNGVEFAIRPFWRIAKTQNDIESPMEGNSRGFHYRLLLHPRGTAGTESESSHLSVFVEAVVQDWYPEYWVFPNVRFELTVVNFKDPKQSVTSWAHWSFSSDATSRGWQKMISHSRLTKAAGFMDDEGTVLIRGKAEPPYPCLWSKAQLYQPQMMWEYIPDRAQRETCTEVCHKLINNRKQEESTEEKISDYMLLKCLDSVVPSISPTLDSDFLGLMVHILYHLREFRRSILMWNCEFGSEVTEETSIIIALQKVFAYMYLYPLAVSCLTYKLSSAEHNQISKYYMYELVPKLTQKNKTQLNKNDNCREDKDTTKDLPTISCCSFEGGRYEWEIKREGVNLNIRKKTPENTMKNNGEYKLVPGSLSQSIGERPDVFNRLLPPPPNIKPILKAMHMTDLQTLEPQDQLVNIHSEMFTMILRDLASAKKQLKLKRLKTSKKEEGDGGEKSESKKEEKTIPVYLRDQTFLETTCKFLFSGSPENETLFKNPSVDDISTIYIRCKHSNSLQKALESTAKTMARYPQVLFFYLYPTKNAKKGELFDVPLRLDCTSIKSTAEYENISEDSRNTNNYDEYGVFECSEDDDDTFGEFDNVCEKEHTSVKWYSLYALIIKEGDLRFEGAGKGTNSFNTLLLRPEEDGPWYRMCEGKVGKLTTKMEFTEWKCHRDFFCVSAVYIAEDYIDMLQVGEVDLMGNLKEWNPNLYYSTLAELGVKEQEILEAIKYQIKSQEKEELKEKEKEKNKMESVKEYLHLRRVGYNHPKLSTCCEIHGYKSEILTKLDEKERKYKYQVPATKREIMRRASRLKIVAPFINWLFNTSKENTTLLNGIVPPSDGKMLVNFLQKREKLFEEEFRNLIAEMFFKEIIENIARNKMYTWSGEECSCGCSCKLCKNRPALLLNENGRFAGEQIKSYLSEPATILFRNIQILRCHLEYFCKDCRNLMIQIQDKSKNQEEKQKINQIFEWKQMGYTQGISGKKESGSTLTHYTSEQIMPVESIKHEMEGNTKYQNVFNTTKLGIGEKGIEMEDFKLTSERSAIFLLDCIWEACIRYTTDCRKILYTKASLEETLTKQSSSLSNGMKSNLGSQSSQSRDMFMMESNMSRSGEMGEGEELSHLDTKYDLTVEEELKLMNYFIEKYELPTVSEMKNYLRKSHVITYPIIRPHELLRSYVRQKYKVDIKGEMESLGFKIVWNEEAFNLKPNIKDLSETELKMYGIQDLKKERYEEIGNNIFGVYEKILTKMLVHMQDVDKQVYPNCYDYVYTVGDIGKIIEAIEVEYSKTIKGIELEYRRLEMEKKSSMETKLLEKKDLEYRRLEAEKKEREENVKCANSCGTPMTNIHVCSQEGCICTGHECRYNFGYTGNVLPFWINKEMGDLSIYSNLRIQAYNEALIEDLSELCLKSDDKKKKKVKPRKQTLEKETCIIPILDIKLVTIVFDQEMANQSDGLVFLNPAYVSRFYNKREMFGQKNKLTQLVSNMRPYDQNVNMSLGYASLLNLSTKTTMGNEYDEEDESKYIMQDGKKVPKPYMILNVNTDNTENEANKVKTAIEIGILTTHDLFLQEGFSCETKVVPTKKILVNSKYNGSNTKVLHLYWAMRKLINKQLPEELFNFGSNKTKKKENCICGYDCPNENECIVKMAWRPCAGDCFMMYALKSDVHTSKFKKKFVYMQPGMDLNYYVNTDKTKGSELTILICGAPSSFYLNGSNTWFPLADDTEYPLLIFKWMCVDTVDLLCLGAIVCDAKKQLQQYIFEWVVPIIRELGYLPSADGSSKEMETAPKEQNKEEDVDKYQVLEECYVRSVQNVRRWSCAIKKINKKSGDVIITQLKRTVDSPATIRFKESVMFMNSVKELAEMETLELLPDTSSFYTESWEKQEQDEPDLGSKLSKKKKRKSTKSAIPSNKKSTFSKRVQPTQQEEQTRTIEEEEDDLETSKKTEKKEELESEYTKSMSGMEYEMEKEKEEDSFSVNEEDSMDKEEADSYNEELEQKESMEDSMETRKEHKEEQMKVKGAEAERGRLEAETSMTEQESGMMEEEKESEYRKLEVEKLEKELERGYDHEGINDMSKLSHLEIMSKETLKGKLEQEESVVSKEEKENKEELNNYITQLIKEEELRTVVELCPKVGIKKVCDQVYNLFEYEFKKEFLQPQKKEYTEMTNKNKRKLQKVKEIHLNKKIKKMVKLVKMMYTRVSGPEPVLEMVKKMHEKHGLKTTFAMSHMLQDYNASIQLMEEVLEFVIEDVVKYSQFFFTDKNYQVKNLLEQMVNSIINNKLINKKLDSSVLFLMYVVGRPRVHAMVNSKEGEEAETNVSTLSMLGNKLSPLSADSRESCKESKVGEESYQGQNMSGEEVEIIANIDEQDYMQEENNILESDINYHRELNKNYGLVTIRTVRETMLSDSEELEELLNKPLLHWLDDEVEQLERLYLQQLKSWWSNRQVIMDKIKANIHPSNHRDSIVIPININSTFPNNSGGLHANTGSNTSGSGANANTNLTRENKERQKDELDLFEFRILLYFAENYPEISLCFNRDTVTLYYSGKLDKRGFFKAIKESKQFFGGKNIRRSIPNLPLEHTDTSMTNASVMDMQLTNNQNALLLLSIKYSNYSQQVDSQFLKSICNYRTFRAFNIPPPPTHSATLQDTI